MVTIQLTSEILFVWVSIDVFGFSYELAKPTKYETRTWKAHTHTHTLGWRHTLGNTQ